MSSYTKGIFISYRREEAAAHAGWLAERLSQHFGEHKVFRDIDSIEPGLDFVEAIQRALDSSEVVIALIGKSWLTAADAKGRPRLQNPDDYVRREIAAALQRNARVLPVLVQGASMPSADELPDDLAALARRNAVELHDTSWGYDVRRLTNALENVVQRQEEAGSWRDTVWHRRTPPTTAAGTREEREPRHPGAQQPEAEAEAARTAPSGGTSWGLRTAMKVTVTVLAVLIIVYILLTLL